MKKTACSGLMFLLVMVAGVIHSPALADSPWIWDQTLQEVVPNGLLSLPTALYTDEDAGRYYVVDGGNNRIVSYDRQGKYLSAFTASNGLDIPFDLVREPGMLWIVEKGKNSLTEIDLENRKMTPHQISNNNMKVYPDRLAIHQDTLYLLDKANGSILALGKDMSRKNVFKCDGCDGGFVDFKIYKGELWALDQKGKEVYRFSLNGTLLAKVQLDPNTVDFPRSLALDDNGLLYILDRHRGAIAVFDSEGGFKYDFLEPGESRGKLYFPIEIEFDPWGRLGVVDEGNGRVQFFVRQ